MTEPTRAQIISLIYDIEIATDIHGEQPALDEPTLGAAADAILAMFAPLMARVAGLEAKSERLRILLQEGVSLDPEEIACDGGITTFMVWQENVKSFSGITPMCPLTHMPENGA